MNREGREETRRTAGYFIAEARKGGNAESTRKLDLTAPIELEAELPGMEPNAEREIAGRQHRDRAFDLVGWGLVHFCASTSEGGMNRFRVGLYLMSKGRGS